MVARSKENNFIHSSYHFDRPRTSENNLQALKSNPEVGFLG